jgi:hypothetical protein
MSVYRSSDHFDLDRACRNRREDAGYIGSHDKGQVFHDEW